VTLSVRLRRSLSQAFTLDVDFAVSAGITILFGASGSGKTTALRAIAGLIRPDTGRIVVDGTPLFDSDQSIDLAPARRGVGYVSQQLALFPHLTVQQNVEYGLGRLPAPDRAARARPILESFSIAHLTARRPGDISGGERQRVALARSLVTSPRALLLDEPLSGLDYGTETRIIDDLRQWNADRAIPILYVTHAHREVFALGERVIVLQEGTVQADGAPHEVLDAPARHAIARIAGFENVFDAAVVSSRAEWGTMVCRIAGTTTDIEVPYSGGQAGARVRLAIRAGDILLANEEPRGLSARNVLAGVISSLRRQGPAIVARVLAGPGFEVHLTPGARDSLQLAEGQRVWIVIKTYSWRVVA
jgi:molybdate transport system ATP-binding protein